MKISSLFCKQNTCSCEATSNSIVFFFHTEAIIGFDPDAYNGSEGTDLFVDLNVKVISGQLGRDVIVLFNTMDGSAIS